MKMTTCGRHQTAGHGEFDVCGFMGPLGVWQCAHCREKDRKDHLREALETIAAGNTDPDRMVELAKEALEAAGL